MSTASPKLRWIQDLLGFKNLEGLTQDLNRMILHVMLNLMAVKRSLGTRQGFGFQPPALAK
jgi:hypothetical protein